MRAAVFWLVVGLVGCGQQAPAPAPRAPEKTKVVDVIDLPGEDGRVYVIDSPAAVEHVKCFLHVRGVASTMACAPPRIEFPSTEPAPR